MATSRRSAWWVVVGYAVWSVLNVMLIVLMSTADNPRWWKFLFAAAFLVISVGGLVDGLKKVRAQEQVTGALPPTS